MGGFSIQDAVRIARTERTRHRREFGGSESGRIVRSVALLAVTIALGTLAYALGRDLAAGRPLPRGDLLLVALLGFGWTGWRSAQVTHARFERLRPEFLLTTVETTSAALGLLCFVAARVAVTLAAPTVGVAVGFAVGLRAPAVALTVAVATAALAALAVGLGSASRLAAHLVGRRLARGGLYGDLLVVFGWLPVLVVWVGLQETSVSLPSLLARLASLPPAWVVDLALVGASGRVDLEASRAFGALCLVALTVPLSAAATAAVARRIWEADAIDSTAPRGSHAFVGDGWLDRVFGDRVSRPVRTVARKRLLVEPRVPRGLLSTAYVLAFAVLVLLPAFAVLGAPLLLLFVIALALAAGIAVGAAPIGVEYRGLPMLLTTLDGREFVGGHLLATLVVGLPLVALVVLPLGVVSPASVPETTALVLAGVAGSVCTAAVCLALELAVDRDDLVPVPSFFTTVTVYSEAGSAPFRRLGTTFAIVSLVYLPAVLGNVPGVYATVSTAGLPAGAVRLGSLLGTILVAVGVSSVASRIAIRRYREYRLE